MGMSQDFTIVKHARKSAISIMHKPNCTIINNIQIISLTNKAKSIDECR